MGEGAGAGEWVRVSGVPAIEEVAEGVDGMPLQVHPVQLHLDLMRVRVRARVRVRGEGEGEAAPVHLNPDHQHGRARRQ